jgi:hypothetical protein
MRPDHQGKLRAAQYQVGFNREEAERIAREKMFEADRKYWHEAREKFTSQRGLINAIEDEIYPTLVTLVTVNGKIGTGFFQHSQWLVSNAHVIRSADSIIGAKIIDHQLTEFNLEAEASYHRPSEKAEAPDVVIVKTNSRSNGNYRALQTQFTLDDAYKYIYTFYVAPSLIKPNHFDVKFLNLRSKPDTYPVTYECIDGSTPEPGCSGAPIIEARVLLGHVPKWQFKVIGILYARCFPSYYNEHIAPTPQAATPKTKLVCTIPLSQEFRQILQILYAGESAERTQLMAAAASRFHDEKGKRDSDKYVEMSNAYKEDESNKLKRFESGETELNITLPDGLEKLFYDRIMAIELSLLIKAVRKKELKKEFERFPYVPSIEPQDLKDDFDGFITKIKGYDEIKLQKIDNFDSSPKLFFRLDVEGGGSSDWKIDIQDNTGNFHTSKKEPLSSTFATAKLSNTSNKISGEKLAELLLASQKDKEAKYFSLIQNTSSTTSVPDSKSRKKGSRHAPIPPGSDEEVQYSNFNKRAEQKGLSVVSPEKLKALLDLPEGVMLGTAINDGGCFFDALAQAVNSFNQTDEHSEKSFRKACFKLYQSNKALVDKLNLADFRGYLPQDYNYDDVQYTHDDIESSSAKRTFIWGRYDIEGKLLCKYLGISFVCIEINNDPDSDGLIQTYYFIAEHSCTRIPAHSDLLSVYPTLLVGQKDLHYIPILHLTDELQLDEKKLGNNFPPPEPTSKDTGFIKTKHDASSFEESKQLNVKPSAPKLDPSSGSKKDKKHTSMESPSRTPGTYFHDKKEPTPSSISPIKNPGMALKKPAKKQSQKAESTNEDGQNNQKRL